MKINLFRKSVFVCVLLAWLGLSSHSFAESLPEESIKHVINQVLKVLEQDDMASMMKRFKASALIEAEIDFQEMAKRILATNWKQINDKQKKVFINLFRQILLNDHWSRISQFSGEKISYIATSIENDTLATVDTVIERPDKQAVIPVSYRMILKSGKWKVYDVMIENLSLIQSYRQEYAAIINNSDFEGLLKHMERESRKGRR